MTPYLLPLAFLILLVGNLVPLDFCYDPSSRVSGCCYACKPESRYGFSFGDFKLVFSMSSFPSGRGPPAVLRGVA